MSEIIKLIAAEIQAHGPISFASYMEKALYGAHGYYSSARGKIGTSAQDGSDFATAPEISPLFAQCIAAQAAPILAASAPYVLELGAGTGQLAFDLIQALDELRTAPHTYFILELSPNLRARQQAKLAQFGARVQWLTQLPNSFSGLVLANEVLDAVPVEVVQKTPQGWRAECVDILHGQFKWHQSDAQKIPAQVQKFPAQVPKLPRAVNFEPSTHHAQLQKNCDDYLHTYLDADLLKPLSIGYTSELHLQAAGLVKTLAELLHTGAALFVDYGFPAHEYYHPQRHAGTLMCHRAHHSHSDVFYAPGAEDLTAHVNFSAMAQAAIDAGADHVGYTSQARFLLNCGLLNAFEKTQTSTARQALNTLISEAEMGELFKVWAFSKNLQSLDWQGFAAGDRSHTL